MKVAIVHYWLLGMRGGEKVVEALCRLFPNADLFTLFYQPDRVSSLIRSRRVTTSFLNPGRRIYRSLLPLMPMALEQFDLREYDLVISSESGPAKGVITKADARHICYCHTPMRYLWDLYPDYLRDFTHSKLRRALMSPLAHYLRLWDFAAAGRVDHFIANSENTKRRVMKAYRRDAQVIYPPVPVDTFFHRPSEDYFLIVSELAPYKRLDYAVRAFSSTGRRLRIVGDGPEYKRLRGLAGKNVEFCGRTPDHELRALYSGCRALLLPGEEDFGITIVEALASGKPVIAFARGGALEVVPDRGGVLYDRCDEQGLTEALLRFEALEATFNPLSLRAHAARFREERFAEQFMAAVATDGVRRAANAGSAARP
jgi:glycosyltransferase involved in cell wall biosynthesis